MYWGEKEMTKLTYNKEMLQDFVLPSLEEGISTLSDAIYNTSFRIPTDFQYYTYMMNLRNNTNKSLQKLKSSKNWLEKSISRIDTTLEEIDSSLSNLEEIMIKEKNPSVRIID